MLLSEHSFTVWVYSSSISFFREIKLVFWFYLVIYFASILTTKESWPCVCEFMVVTDRLCEYGSCLDVWKFNLSALVLQLSQVFLLTLIGFKLFLCLNSLGLPLKWNTLFVRLVGRNKCRQSKSHILCRCIVDRVKSIVSLMRKVLSSCIFCLESWIIFHGVGHPKIDTHRALCCNCVMIALH